MGHLCLTLRIPWRDPQKTVGGGLTRSTESTRSSSGKARPRSELASVAIESEADLLSKWRPRIQIAGELFTKKSEKGFIAVVRLYHPVSPGPHVAGAVGVA